jgi:predicted amidophosphoribosyltransferase
MLRGVLYTFLPRSCGGCGDRDGHGWCGSCDLALATEIVGVRDARVAAAFRARLPAVPVAGAYDGVLRRTLLAYKERGRRDLARRLGDALAVSIRRAARGSEVPVAIVPVPASPAALRRRGWDHVATLIGASGGLPTPCPLLGWERQVADQGSLGAGGRVGNLHGALSVRCRGQGQALRPAIVLVDDVVTTGATLAEAARACRQGGFDVIGAAALAATSTKGRALE